MRRLAAALLTLVAVAAAAAAQSVPAQNWPSRQITLVVPFPVGGGNDLIARLVAEKLTAALGQQVIVDNRGGANGVLGARSAARAAPDGHTLLFVNTSATSINPALYANVGYDVHADFAPVGMIAEMGIGIVVNPAFPAKSVGELIALAKRDPGKLNIGTSALGSGSYLSAELFKATTALDVTLVPYKGAAALSNDVLGGHVPAMFSVLPPALGNIQAGSLRALAVTTPKRMSLLPDVPTVAESGLPGFEAVLRYGLLAPAGTPPAVIERLNKELRALADADDVKQRVAKEGGEVLTSSPQAYADNMRREDAVWGPLVKKLNLKID